MGRYLKNAVLLTGSGLVLRALGMVFRVVLAGKIGSEGMGLYQLMFTLYNVSISLATAGLSVAAARLTTQLENTQDPPGPVVERIGFFGLCLGLLAGGLQFVLAKPAAEYWLGDSRVTLALRILAPSLPFMAVAGVWRGYFLARRQVMPNVLSQTVEQLVRLGLVFWLVELSVPYGLGWGCCAVAVGTTVSEAVSCGMMARYYRKALPSPGKPSRKWDREIWKIILPLQGDRCLSSGLHAAENALVPICLAVYLGSRQEALSQYGALRGMAMPVVFFPFSFLAALSTLLLPEITAAYTRRQYRTIQSLIDRTMVLTTTISFLAGGLCTLCGLPLGQLLYGNEQVGRYLMALGPVVPFMYVEGMIDGILNGLGEQLAGFRYSLGDSILRIVCVAVLLPRYGVQGFLWMMAASNCITCFLNVRRMLLVSRMEMRWWRWTAAPLVSLGLGMGAALWLRQCADMTYLGDIFFCGGLCAAIYLVLCWALGLGEVVRNLIFKK